jgi:hypothetical protein
MSIARSTSLHVRDHSKELARWTLFSMKRNDGKRFMIGA